MANRDDRNAGKLLGFSLGEWILIWMLVINVGGVGYALFIPWWRQNWQ